MNIIHKGALYALFFCLLIPLSGLGQSKLRIGAVGYAEHHQLNTVEYQLPVRGVQLELGWGKHLSLVANACKAESQFYDPIKTQFLRLYDCKGAGLRLQYAFFPGKKIRPFVFAGVQRENLKITYTDWSRRNETIRENHFSAIGLGVDAWLLPFLKLRVEAGRSGDWFGL